MPALDEYAPPDGRETITAPDGDGQYWADGARYVYARYRTLDAHDNRTGPYRWWRPTHYRLGKKQTLADWVAAKE